MLLHYVIEGNPGARPLLLVRGLARSGRYWLRVREELVQRLRLIVPDNIGVGRSPAPPPPYSTRRMARDLVAVLDHAGLDRVNVFGISLGGMIAQRLAIDHPDRVERLVLGCTSPGGRWGPRLRLPGLLGMARSASMPPDRGARHVARVLVSPEFLRQHPEVADEWARLAVEDPVTSRGLFGQISAALRHDASRELSAVRVPTLVITGDRDELIHPGESHRIARRMPNARLVILPGVGHDFPTEVPDKTARLVCEFLG